MYYYSSRLWSRGYIWFIHFRGGWYKYLYNKIQDLKNTKHSLQAKHCTILFFFFFLWFLSVAKAVMTFLVLLSCSISIINVYIIVQFFISISLRLPSFHGVRKCKRKTGLFMSVPIHWETGSTLDAELRFTSPNTLYSFNIFRIKRMDINKFVSI